MFEQLMPVLAERGYCCTAIDLMGYGRSDRRLETWLVEEFSDNLVEAIAALELRPRAILGGHFTSLVAVDISLRHAGVVDKLILDGIPAWSDQERAERLGRNAGAPWLSADGASIQQRWNKTLAVLTKADPKAEVKPEAQSALLDAFVAFTALDHKPGPEVAFFKYPTAARLAAVQHPTLVIGSPTDTLRSCHEAAVSMIPGARSHVFEDINPLYYLTRECPLDRLSEYANVVGNFIRS